MTIIIHVKGGKPLVWDNLTQREVNDAINMVSTRRLDEVGVKITVTD